MSKPTVHFPKTCIIVVSYNFEPWLDTCLQTMAQSTYPATFVVIDNASQDKTCERIKRDYPNIVLLENQENLGFGRANNIGIRYALENGFEYVFLLNQDAWLQPDALSRLVSAAEKNTTYGILSPVHLNGKGIDLDAGFAHYLSVKNVDELRNTSSSEIIDTSFVNAALWLIPSRVLRQVGGFAPLFAHYGEDVNLAQRVRKNGYKIGVVVAASGYHDRELREISRKKFFYSEFVYFLTETANLWHSCAGAFAYGVLAAQKKALMSLFQCNFNAFANYTLMSVKLLCRAREILRTRRITSTKGAHFL